MQHLILPLGSGLLGVSQNCANLVRHPQAEPFGEDYVNGLSSLSTMEKFWHMLRHLPQRWHIHLKPTPAWCIWTY